MAENQIIKSGSTTNHPILARESHSNKPMKVPGGPLLNQNLFSFCFPLFYFNNFFLPNYSSSNKKMMFIMEGMLSKSLRSQYWPAISMDWIVEAGQKVKDPNARLISPEALSIHMECHNLSNRMIKTFFKTRKKKNSNRVRFRQSFIENTNFMWLCPTSITNIF